MNYTLKKLPERTVKPRQIGYTMAMDKGLSVRQAEDFVATCARDRKSTRLNSSHQ